MFTALVITRVIIYSFYAVGIRVKKLYGRRKGKKKRSISSEKETVLWCFCGIDPGGIRTDGESIPRAASGA